MGRQAWWEKAHTLVIFISWTFVTFVDSLSHCDTCKTLSGGTYTLNQIVPKENIQITKGKLNTYTYHGDSGKLSWCTTPSHLYWYEMQARLSIATIALIAQPMFIITKQWWETRLSSAPFYSTRENLSSPGRRSMARLVCHGRRRSLRHLRLCLQCNLNYTLMSRPVGHRSTTYQSTMVLTIIVSLDAKSFPLPLRVSSL
jgi:hypothetical protein